MKGNGLTNIARNKLTPEWVKRPRWKRWKREHPAGMTLEETSDAIVEAYAPLHAIMAEVMDDHNAKLNEILKDLATKAVGRDF